MSNREKESDLMLDVGLANEIKLAARRAGATSADLKQLAEGNMFARILPIIREKKENKFLKLISDQALIIGPTDGSEILADASDVFAFIDSDFRKWKADEPGTPTGETPVGVYEVAKDATYTQMFGSLSADISRLCLTQAQIKGFVKQHRDWLRTDGFATFFLFKSYNQFIVAGVDFHSDGRLWVSVDRFEDARVWDAENRRRLAAPRLA